MGLGYGRQAGVRSAPEVHDSDGLLIAGANGEWLWRPLARPAGVSVSRFEYQGLNGFGLMQRDREPSHYRDDEAKYHLRPSVWITPHSRGERVPWSCWIGPPTPRQ